MRIYGFSPHPEATIAYNAAPVMPHQSVAPELNVVQGLRLAGRLNHDTFTRTTPIAAEPGPSIAYTPLPHAEALRQLTSMTSAAARAHLAQDMASGKTTDLTRVAGWLSAAQQAEKIQFASRDNAAENFKQNLGKALTAMREGDWPATRLYLQRARREMFDFTGLRTITTTESKFPPNNPFALHY